MSDLFLLHFEPAYQHAGHYLGYAKGTGRVGEYAKRVAAGKVHAPHPLVERALLQGSEITVAAIFYGDNRDERRRLRRQGGLSRHCPVCRARGYYHK